MAADDTVTHRSWSTGPSHAPVGMAVYRYDSTAGSTGAGTHTMVCEPSHLPIPTPDEVITCVRTGTDDVPVVRGRVNVLPSGCYATADSTGPTTLAVVSHQDNAQQCGATVCAVRTTRSRVTMWRQKVSNETLIVNIVNNARDAIAGARNVRKRPPTDPPTGPTDTFNGVALIAYRLLCDQPAQQKAPSYIINLHTAIHHSASHGPNQQHPSRT